MLITPNATTTALAGIHQRRPKRRIANTRSAPPAAANTASIAVLLTTSPAQPAQSCVTSPTSLARWREIAAIGRFATVTITASAAPDSGAGAEDRPLERPSRRRGGTT